MRTVVIGAMSEKNFELISHELYIRMPSSLISRYYDFDNCKAVFCFEDSDCVPDCMQPYIVGKPFSKQDLVLIDEGIKPYMKYTLGEKIINPPKK